MFGPFAPLPYVMVCPLVLPPTSPESSFFVGFGVVLEPEDGFGVLLPEDGFGVVLGVGFGAFGFLTASFESSTRIVS